jgi:hypothetical protein
MVKVLVTDEDDMRFVALRNLIGVGVDHPRSRNPKSVMSDTSEFQIQKFHGLASFPDKIISSLRLPLCSTGSSAAAMSGTGIKNTIENK